MSETSDKTSKTRKSKAAAEREKRLADALRANLRRRKGAESANPKPGHSSPDGEPD